MIYISHRGNLYKPQPKYENSIPYIQEALDRGYDVEVDVWYNDRDGYYLGHDYPQYKVDIEFLTNTRLWIHCKNSLALYKLTNFKGLNYFWHQNDDYTLTSQNMIWCYPGKTIPFLNKERAICVMPEIHLTNVEGFGGICSDNIEYYRYG